MSRDVVFVFRINVTWPPETAISVAKKDIMDPSVLNYVQKGVAHAIQWKRARHALMAFIWLTSSAYPYVKIAILANGTKKLTFIYVTFVKKVTMQKMACVKSVAVHAKTVRVKELLLSVWKVA